MATNYAERYANAALEAFALDSLTNVFSAKYDWTDVKTVNVFTNATVAPSAYTPSAGYGTPTLIGNSKDALTVTQDDFFSAVIDKLDMESTAGTMRAGEWLVTEIRQEVTPSIDEYVFDALWTACPSAQISASAAITSANAYSSFLTGNLALTNAKVPRGGRVAFASATFINTLKFDTNYVKASDLAQSEIVFNGMAGRCDGVPIIEVPDSMLNATDHHMDFIIVHTSAVALPIKLADYQVIAQSEQYSGSRVNGRVVYDCFLLDALNNGIYIHKHAG
jgi:hypothetical protein